MIKHDLLLSIIFSFMTVGLSAQGGKLDTSFGTEGIMITTLSKSTSAPSAILEQQDEKIIIGGWSGNGEAVLTRLNPDGSGDNSFGFNGVVTTNVGSVDDRFYSVALQDDGKIVAAGYSQNNRFIQDFLLVRYDKFGSLDPTFGNGGIVISAFNLGFGDYVIRSVLVQPDGKIVVAGYVEYYLSGQFLVARYNENGSLDEEFGSGGKLLTNISPQKDRVRSVVIQPDGKIIVSGYSNVNSKDDNFALARYTPEGKLDRSFGKEGLIITDFNGFSDRVTSSVLQPDGKIVVAGYSRDSTNWDFALARYSKKGILDVSFGVGGKLTTPLGPLKDFVLDIALQSDGKIIVVGYTDSDDDRDFAICRYHQNGLLDHSFGAKGIVTTDFNCGQDIANAVFIRADGKIVVGGFGETFYMARYLPK
jgi:uncharacterized delta-60 repeat protein